MDWLTITLFSQIAFTSWFALTHWVSMPPLNDLSKEAFPNERKTNLVLHVFQITSIIGFFYQIQWMMYIGVIFWTISLVGHITSWWLPYFFGIPKGFLENALEDNAKTYHFLPPRKNHPIPDLTHCIIGILCLFACISSWCSLLEYTS